MMSIEEQNSKDTKETAANDVAAGFITGHYATRRVWIDGKPLPLRESLKVCNHSPTGFNWGYGGSGPAQLALAILLKFTDKQTAVCLHQSFKSEFIAPAGEKLIISMKDVVNWIKKQRNRAA